MRTQHWGLFVGALFALACGKPASFETRESIEQLHVTHATPGQTLIVLDAKGKEAARGVADEQGSLVFRNLTPGKGYTVRTEGKDFEVTKPLHVMSVEESKPDPASYGQQVLKPGYNYITMRDGTTLAAFVTLPAGAEGQTFPTVVSYAGYDMAREAPPYAGLEFLYEAFPVLETPPTDASSMLAGMLGYATVSVNIRGTGCSGGAYDYFEKLQLLDGYDVIEIVAAQRWVRHHKVGMVGLSYPGITQMYVAAQKPPSLAAIAAESVIASTDTTLLPGGILNDGFAISWVEHVLNGAHPYGQGWEQARVDKGDTICAENQLLHSQMIDNVEQARQIKFYVPAEHDRFSPLTFVKDIEVPVFLSGQWQDEQTGPYFAMLFDKFTSSPSVHFNATNGIHPDGFNPAIVPDWQAFLEIYVAQRAPLSLDTLRALSPQLYQQVYSSNVALGPSRFEGYDTLAEAKAAWEAQPKVRVEFENGAGKLDDPGAPVTVFEHSFSQWPPAELTAKTLYFAQDGALHDAPPTETDSASQYAFDFARGAKGSLANGAGPWDKLPNYDWESPASGAAVVMESAPLTETTVLMGTASFDLWFNAPVDGADVQVSLSEVRTDGKEVYVQSGWLRAGHRKPGPKATEFWPAQTLMEDAWEPLTPGTWAPMRIGTAQFAHAFRAGSKIRVTVDTPGGTRTDWRFKLDDYGAGIRYGIGHDATHASKVVLPVIAGLGADVPAALPACPGLRAQPCRTAQPVANAPFVP